MDKVCLERAFTFLSDDVVVCNLDNALQGLLVPTCNIMDRLFSHYSFIPNGELPTLILAYSIFVWRYNECRDLGVSVEDSLRIAQGAVISNPNISKFLARKGYIKINDMAGVEDEF